MRDALISQPSSSWLLAPGGDYWIAEAVLWIAEWAPTMHICRGRHIDCHAGIMSRLSIKDSFGWVVNRWIHSRKPYD